MNQKNDPSRTGNPLINDPTSLISVSYTHLDVYKRQVLAVPPLLSVPPCLPPLPEQAASDKVSSAAVQRSPNFFIFSLLVSITLTNTVVLYHGKAYKKSDKCHF